MRNPTIIPYERRCDGVTVYRLYDPRNLTRNGRTFVGTAASIEQAREWWSEYLATGKRFTRRGSAQTVERRCWIVPRKTKFELYGHDHGEKGRNWIGVAHTQAEADAMKAAYMKTGIKPQSKGRVNGPRNTRKFVQTPISLPTPYSAHQNALTDDRLAMMKQMLARIG